MRAGACSRTAQGSALLRAAHLVLDRPPWLVEDRDAQRLLGPFARLLLGARWPLRTVERCAPALAAARAQALVRTRFAEDRLRDAVDRGVRQYVVISAGLDSFALRCRAPLRVYELDHPASQAWKRQRLAALGTAESHRAILVPLDLACGSVDRALLDCGFAAAEPAFFAWLGTTYYLPRPIVVRTLAALAKVAAPGSELVLDYLLPDSWLSAAEQSQLGVARCFAALCGEPVRSAFDPHQLETDLAGCGWEVVEDLSACAQQRSYLAGRGDALRVPSWNHLLRASRAGAT